MSRAFQWRLHSQHTAEKERRREAVWCVFFHCNSGTSATLALNAALQLYSWPWSSTSSPSAAERWEMREWIHGLLSVKICPYFSAMVTRERSLAGKYWSPRTTKLSVERRRNEEMVHSTKREGKARAIDYQSRTEDGEWQNIWDLKPVWGHLGGFGLWQKGPSGLVRSLSTYE